MVLVLWPLSLATELGLIKMFSPSTHSLILGLVQPRTARQYFLVFLPLSDHSLDRAERGIRDFQGQNSLNL